MCTWPIPSLCHYYRAHHYDTPDAAIISPEMTKISVPFFGAHYWDTLDRTSCQKSSDFIYFMVPIFVLNGTARRSQTISFIGLLILISWNKLRNIFRPYQFNCKILYMFVKNAANIQ